MIPNTTYPCGCRIRSGVDPKDGCDTARLYACPLGERCPNAALFVKTVNALAAEGDATVTHHRMERKGQMPEGWVPLVEEVSDENPDAPLEPIDQTFDCGCRIVGDPPAVEGGPPMVVFFACPKNMDCPRALEYLLMLKSMGEEVQIG